MAKLPCPAELWPAFSALLDEALDIPAERRPAWFAMLGEEHAAVRPWLAKVLADESATNAPDFMSPLIVDESALVEFSAGQLIGPYRLNRRLGSGGMGEVWLSSRSDGALNRQVALKLPHIHLLAHVLRRRFERERDILAALSHPHIAQLYDAGVADSQHPYLAMEWVQGISIIEHCVERKLAMDGRLDLFMQVLEAVGYAHGRLIAHRDLKPSNILVTADGRVKLLDFGIAKLLDTSAEKGATQLTHMGSCIATPAYAAPEQLTGEPITVAVDLYALGVILHELLTGQRPFPEGRGKSAERLKTPRASSRVDPVQAGFLGGMNARQLRRALSGDLDAIIAKALEPDPARRYATAESFAADLRRSRAHRPISARRVSRTSLAFKFLQRHRLGAAMTAALTVALIGGSIGIAWQAVRAEREAQRATTIKDFLIGVFRASDPRIASNKPRGEITAKELLDVSAKQIESSFANQPVTQLQLLGVTADIYRELDETRRSSELYGREIELASKLPGTDPAYAIDGLLGQAYNADADGNDALALRLLAQADPLIRRARLDGTAVRARWLVMRGEALMGDAAKVDEAQRSLEAAAALFDAVAPRDSRYPDTLSDLGSLTLERSRFATAAGYYRQAISVAESDTHLQGSLLLAYAGLALSLKNLGDFDAAAAAFERGTDIASRTYGTDSHNYWVIASDLAQFRYERGDRIVALADFDKLVHRLPDDRAALKNATDALEASYLLRKYGRCLAKDGQSQKAIAMLERAQLLLEDTARHPTDLAFLELDLGRAYEAGGRIENARKSLLAALDAFAALEAPAVQLSIAHELWGRFLLSQLDADTAEREFREAIRLSSGHLREPAINAQAGLAAVWVARGNAERALEASGAAVDALEHIEGSYDVRIRPYVWSIRAHALRLAGRIADGRVFAARTMEAVAVDFDPGSREVSEAKMLVKGLADAPVGASPLAGAPRLVGAPSLR